MQISGLKYTADFSKPITERVTASTKTDGSPIEDAQTYTVVVNSFMAAGGDNYKVLVDGTDRLVGRTDLEALYDYMVKTFQGGKITAAIEGRITNLNATP